METKYTDEINAQVVIRLLKEHGIRKVIASPGTTNMAFVGSVQTDSYFEVISSVDERSAAYMACGLSAESGEPVVLSCTGATASRNYLPGLTEAFYRKLPILAITSIQSIARVGHHVAQVIDRSSIQKDVAKLSVTLPIVKDNDDLWDCEIKVNKAILELKRHGGGPVHINLQTKYSRNYSVKELPKYRVIQRITPYNGFPTLPQGKIALFIGAHAKMSNELTLAIDDFCKSNNAVVFCDHTSSYKGEYRVLYSLYGSQHLKDRTKLQPNLIIHIGEISGDYGSIGSFGDSKVWRVNEDGEIRDTFRKLELVFEMPEVVFFKQYIINSQTNKSYLQMCHEEILDLQNKIPELPFSNLWIASKLSKQMPEKSVIYFGILNSLRSWNYFEVSKSIDTMSNVGGFGIDGCLSSLLGASLSNPERMCFGIIGDLAFFYDMNSLGNRHVGSNLRILVINNGVGIEFKNYNHHAAEFGEDANAFIAAAGHYGNKSKELIKHYSQDLGFEYITASSKLEFEKNINQFLNIETQKKSMIFEVFTNDTDESDALKIMNNLDQNASIKAKNIARSILGDSGVNILKKVLGK